VSRSLRPVRLLARFRPRESRAATSPPGGPRYRSLR
jgi:hypothetical protein